MQSVLTFLLGPGATARDALLAVVDVAVVAFVCYQVLRFIRGTRATAILVGLSLLGLAYAGAEGAGLATLSWLLGHFLSYSFIFGVIVLFQADLRRALAELGRTSRLSRLVARLGQDDRAAFLRRLDERFAALDGIEVASTTTTPPFTGGDGRQIEVDGRRVFLWRIPAKTAAAR